MDINIKLTIDDRIVAFTKRVLRPRWAKAVAATLAVAIPVTIYATSTGGMTIFKAGEVASASAINENFKKLRDCPDDMVAVGDFCIDKYEASIWTEIDGGAVASTSDAGCQVNGSNCAYFARPVEGIQPASGINWYRAARACANSGKRLPTNAEWQVAATGTPDPGVSSVATGCLTSAAQRRITGSQGGQSNCVSNFGVWDMIGNVEEWVADWQGVVGNSGETVNSSLAGATWSSDAYIHGGPRNDTNPSFAADLSLRPSNPQFSGSADAVGNPMSPAAMIRGGSYQDLSAGFPHLNSGGAAAGTHFIRLDMGPGQSDPKFGFRCARNR